MKRDERRRPQPFCSARARARARARAPLHAAGRRRSAFALACPLRTPAHVQIAHTILPKKGQHGWLVLYTLGANGPTQEVCVVGWLVGWLVGSLHSRGQWAGSGGLGGLRCVCVPKLKTCVDKCACNRELKMNTGAPYGVLLLLLLLLLLRFLPTASCAARRANDRVRHVDLDRWPPPVAPAHAVGVPILRPERHARRCRGAHHRHRVVLEAA